MPEGAALSWPLPDIVIRSKSGFANQEPHHDQPTRRYRNCRDRAARTDNELNRAREDCCRPIR